MIDLDKFIEFQIDDNVNERVISARVRLGVAKIIDESQMARGNREDITDIVKRDLVEQLKNEIYGETEKRIKELEAQLQYVRAEYYNCCKVHGYRKTDR